jgi:hypothetical protein
MNPPRIRHADECNATNTRADFIPAHVHYRAERCAEVWHEAGPGAENARLTCTRLQRKGLKVFLVAAPNTNHYRGIDP